MPRQDLSPQDRAFMMQGLSNSEALSEGLVDFDDFGGSFDYLDHDDSSDTAPPRHISPVDPVQEQVARQVEQLKQITKEEWDTMTGEELDQLVADIF